MRKTDKQIRNGIHASIYVRVTKVTYPGPMVPEKPFFLVETFLVF